jgi:hypothetical protein
MEAKSFGWPDVTILTVPHPIGAGQTPEMVKTKVINVMEKMVKMIVGEK